MKITTFRIIVLSLLTTIAGCGSASSSAPSSLPTTSVKIGSKTFDLEIANTESSRERGLMKRDTLPVGRGMIFVFPGERPRSFWMRNTRIPLDILFLRADGEVIKIAQMKPYDELTQTRSGEPAKYAIELNRGAAEEAGVKVGDKIEIPPEAREPGD